MLWDAGAKIRYKTLPNHVVIADWGVHYRQPSVKCLLVLRLLCRTTFPTRNHPLTTLTFFYLG